MSLKKYGMGKIHPEGGEAPRPEPALCEYALNVLHVDHPVRKKVYHLVTTKSFDFVIIFFILANSIVMAMTDYRVGCLGRNPEKEDFGFPDKNRCALNALVTLLNDYIFGAVFLLEMVLKVVAFGFAWEGENTYMSDKWNVLDFVCVLAWMVAQLRIGGMPNLTYFKSFRLLRPLKSLSKFPGLRAIVSTFLAAIPRLKDVVILLLFLLLVCSIACMQFFKGFLHYRCRVTRYPTRVPETWYQKCAFSDYPDGNCIKNRYFPTQAEFEAYRNATVTWDLATSAEWGNYSKSAAYAAIVATYNWGTLASDWACTSPRYNAATGYPHGVPVTAEYPGRRWNGGEFFGKANKRKLWAEPKRCIWIVDEDDTRPCSLPGNGGLHVCYKNARQQRGRYIDSSQYQNKANPHQSLSRQYTETTCASNYDEFGHRRFRYVPKLYKELKLRNTVPGAFEDWGRWSPSFFRSMYPEFIPELNYGYTNFDNIGFAMVSLFQAVTMEGWTDIMYMCMDVFSPTAAVVLFLGLFAVGSMLVLNLVLGVIADTLGDEEEAQEAQERAAAQEHQEHQQQQQHQRPNDDDLVPPTQQQQQQQQQQTECATPSRRILMREDSILRGVKRRAFLVESDATWRVTLLDVVQSAYFSNIIYACIGLNTLALCLDDYPRQSEWSQAMELINVALTLVFIIEMFMKLGAVGVAGYVEDQFNIFDGCIVIVSILDLLLAAGNVSFGGGAVFSALRCFRVFRIFKLAKSWTSLQVLLATIYETTQEIGNFLVLLLLFAFIFALAGQQLFANQFRFDEATGAKVAFDYEFPEDPDTVGRAKNYNFYRQSRGRKQVSTAFKNADPEMSNFDDFGLAFITVFGILTGESWNLVMYDMIRGTSFAIGTIYMGLTIIILSFCLMNMFLAILLSKFEDNEELSRPRASVASPGISSSSIRQINSFKKAARAVLVLKSTSSSVKPHEDSSSAKRLLPGASGGDDGLVALPPPQTLSSSSSSSSSLPPDAQHQHRRRRRVVAPNEHEEEDDDDGEAPQEPKKCQSTPPRAAEEDEPPFVEEEEEEEGGEEEGEEDKALGLFLPEHPVRKFCIGAIENPMFDRFIVVCICTSSVLLAMRTPLMNDKSDFLLTLDALDLVFTIVFFVECAMKITALGFLLNGPKSYIREPWNVLDFVIVCFGAADLMGGDSVRAFKALRVFRVFRPLRMLARSPGLRLVLNSLIVAIPSAFNVMVVCVLYMFIFAIMGVGFFKGQMNWCDVESYPLPDASLQEILDKPITLEHAIANGMFERVYNATNGESTCWLDWDKDFINGKSYFNYDTRVASEFSVGVEVARRERNVFFLSSKFSRDIEKPKNGVSKATLDFFAAHPHYLERTSFRANFEEDDDDKKIGNLDEYTPTSKDMCRCLFREEAAWTNSQYLNFDTVSNAFLLLFEIYSTEGWLDYMFQNVDQNGIEMQPIRDHRYRHEQRTPPRFYAFFYHVAFQVVGGFFVMQLFTGIIMENYMKLKARAESDGRAGILMTALQEQWVKTQHFLIHKIRPKRRLKPKIVAFHQIVEGDHKDRFEAAIMTCIVMNAVVMASDVFGQPPAATLAIAVINYCFAGIFAVEAVLKIGGIGWGAYWADASNRLDFIIVIGTLGGIVLTQAEIVSIGGVASVVRLFRIARIFRIFSSAKNMRKQIAALVSALPGLFNVAVVLMIIFLIWSILLVDMFAHIEYSSTIHPNANFQHVPIAVLTLIRFTTGENWNGFMHELAADHKTPGCYDAEKFLDVRTEMYRGSSQTNEYWQDKWCTRLDGGDRNVCPCQSFWKDGHLTDVCQKFSSYDGCCVPLAGCGDKWWAGLIIRTFDLLVTGVVLNLFVANILDAYQREDEEDELGLSGTDLDNFVEDWARFDENATWLIKVSQLKDLIQILDEPMGFGEQYVASHDELEIEILKLGLRVRKPNKSSEDDIGETRLHIMDVAMALGKRIVVKASGDDDDLPEIKNETEVCEDATPLLERYFGRKLVTVVHNNNNTATSRSATTTDDTPPPATTKNPMLPPQQPTATAGGDAPPSTTTTTTTTTEEEENPDDGDNKSSDTLRRSRPDTPVASKLPP
ncbi:hypothetical protein CTAYLR_003319 [Chrysophaeum taylorii]|uniref:Ion transport domain-containing protein n=1 Tax=Chrysophaeum taylorii TaxID=2483200 RepID=A0AAD7UIX3_9STRA|nr:hypothetical protein CTAYLR_003319 [Chrysophaeum taylorii]